MLMFIDILHGIAGEPVMYSAAFLLTWETVTWHQLRCLDPVISNLTFGPFKIGDTVN